MGYFTSENFNNFTYYLDKFNIQVIFEVTVSQGFS